MKEIKEEAKRHHEAKLHKYGASHEERAHGGSMKKYASGGHVHEVDLECKGKTGPEIKRAHGGKASHPNREKDLNLIEELEHDHMKKHGGKVHHRADGGPIAGGMGPKLGRGRKGKSGKTNVNVVVAGKGDGPGAPPMPPPALGAGPAIPPAPPPKPILPPGAAGPMPPRPMPPAGPMRHGGKVHKGEHKKGHERHEHRRKEHGHSGHRG